MSFEFDFIKTMTKQIFNITGMSCGSCAAKIENSLSKTSGISSCNINFLTGQALVNYDEKKINIEHIYQVVESLGYKVATSESKEEESSQEISQNKEKTDLKNKFILGAILSVIVFLGSFPEWFSYLPKFLSNPYLLLLLTTPVQFYVGARFYQGAWRALIHKTSDMNTLITLGTSAAYLYSLIAVIFPQIFAWQSVEVKYYFDTSAIIITLIILGRYFESVVKGKASSAIKKLIGLQPKTALIIKNGKEIKIPIADLRIGDIVIVKPGEKIPIDGVVIKGESSIDEKVISGESLPVDKYPGDEVIGATQNLSGVLKIEVSHVGTDTVLAQIIKIVEDAQASKAPIQRLADKVSGIFVPIVLAIALLSFIVWLALGANLVFALSIFITVLIIACPCALGLATPTAIMVGTGMGAQKGILIKTGEALETAYKLTTAIFDKTGTLTKGKPALTDILFVREFPITNNQFPNKPQIPNSKQINKLTNQQINILQLAASLEKNSEHPLAEAIYQYAKDKKINLQEVKNFKAIAGHGVKGIIKEEKYYLGNRKLISNEAKLKINEVNKLMEELEDKGRTAMILADNKGIIGIIAVADTLKEDSLEALEILKNMGIKIAMITGDNPRTARAIAKELKIDQVLAEVLPQDKAKEVAKLQKKGEVVAFVGDGINDAPALAKSDLGIAIGSGTDIAMESGQIVLIKDDLRDVAYAIKLSQYTLKKIKQNLFWAFAYNIIGIPVAAGLLYPLTGFLLSPVIAAAAMAFSSISVVLNSTLMGKFLTKDRQ